jgi:uridine kinase
LFCPWLVHLASESIFLRELAFILRPHHYRTLKGTPTSMPGTLILVVGRSGSGKTTLASALAGALRATAATTVLNQDSYFTQPFVAYPDRTDDSFEGPEFIDWAGLRRAARASLRDAGLVVVEGHLVAADARLVDMASACVIVDASAATCRTRRVERSPRTPRARRELEAYMDAYVGPGFLRYGKPALDGLEERCEAAGKGCVRVCTDGGAADSTTAAHVAAVLDVLGRNPSSSPAGADKAGRATGREGGGGGGGGGGDQAVAGRTIFWIGGTSALTRTYFDELPFPPDDRLIVAGLAGEAGAVRSLPVGTHFVSLDLTSPASVRTLFSRAAAVVCGAAASDEAKEGQVRERKGIEGRANGGKGNEKKVDEGVDEGAADDAPPRLLIDTLIIGVRMSLVWGGERHMSLTSNLDTLVRAALSHGARGVLHISSVAVADHVKDQIMLKESDALPPIETYAGAYDRFKRISEDIVTRVCTEGVAGGSTGGSTGGSKVGSKAGSRVGGRTDPTGIETTSTNGSGSSGSLATRSPATRTQPVLFSNLRIGGIFSNDAGSCIQCKSLALQALVGCYLPKCIDCNSSRNVCQAIHMLVEQMPPMPPPTPSSVSSPIPAEGNPFGNGDNGRYPARCMAQTALSALPPIIAPVYYYTRATADPVRLTV